jgi:hypothetical protein
MGQMGMKRKRGVVKRGGLRMGWWRGERGGLGGGVWCRYRLCGVDVLRIVSYYPFTSDFHLIGFGGDGGGDGRSGLQKGEGVLPENFDTEPLEIELGLCALKLGLVGVFKISACWEGIQGCAVTKYTSWVNETLTSFLSSPSATLVNLIIAE